MAKTLEIKETIMNTKAKITVSWIIQSVLDMINAVITDMMM